MLEVYFYENSICSERVLMTLAEKAIEDWVPRPVDLFAGEQFLPAYQALNPDAVVPTLVHDGAVVRESAIICDYLDDLVPARPLKPAAPAAQAAMRAWIHACDQELFEGVAALSFVSVFRERMLEMTTERRLAHWRSQRVLARAVRQADCVANGVDSLYVLRALAAWEQAFTRIEDTLADGRSWLLGTDFTLADLCHAPYIARLAGLSLLPLWLADKPLTAAWFARIAARQSFTTADVGPSATETGDYARAGTAVAAMLGERLAQIRTGTGFDLALAALSPPGS